MNNRDIEKIMQMMDEIGCKEKYFHEVCRYHMETDALAFLRGLRCSSVEMFVLSFSSVDISFAWGGTENGSLYWCNVVWELIIRLEGPMEIASRSILLAKKHGVYDFFLYAMDIALSNEYNSTMFYAKHGKVKMLEAFMAKMALYHDTVVHSMLGCITWIWAAVVREYRRVSCGKNCTSDNAHEWWAKRRHAMLMEIGRLQQ